MRLHRFDKASGLRRLKIKQNKETIVKVGSIVLCTIALLVGSYFVSYAKFETKEEFEIIKTKVGYFEEKKIVIEKYYLNNEISLVAPNKDDGYVFDYAICDNDAVITWDSSTWQLKKVHVAKDSNCYLYFVK